MAKRLLIVTPVPERGAGCRYRIQQYLPFLETEGIRAVVRPFYSDRLFDLVFAEGAYGRKALLACQRAFVRFAQLVSLGSFDGVFIYREALPLGPPVWEWLCARLGKPIVFDFDDAIFLGDTNPVNWILHRMKCAWKVRHVLRWSRQVIAGNAYLAAYAAAHNRRVTVIPTPIDTQRYQPRPPPNGRDAVPVVGWIGTPTTVKYVESHAEAFRRLAARRRFLLRIVGAWRPVRLPAEVPLEECRWDLSGEVEAFQRCDIGIYPLLDDDWSRGKCGFKALQFMACGVPVVASRVGMNREIIAHGASGFLASSPDEWVEALEALLDDAALRRRIGEAARATVEARYALTVHAPSFVRVVQNSLAGRQEGA